MFTFTKQKFMKKHRLLIDSDIFCVSNKFRSLYVQAKKSYTYLAMVNYCCVANCARNSRNSSHLFFHILPKEPHRQKLWCEAAGRPDILEKTPEQRSFYRICSKHFDVSSIKNKHLSVNAVPTLLLPGTETQDEQPGHQETCNNCLNTMFGFRYKCTTCKNYDLCSRCEMLETHNQHFMLRIPTPVAFDEINRIIKKIQQPDDPDCSSDDEPITKYKKVDDNLTELSNDVKQEIRNEVLKLFKPQRKVYKNSPKMKRTASNGKGGKMQKTTESEVISDPFFSSEVVFADVNDLPMSVGSVVEVKTENMYEMVLDGNIF